MCADSSSLAYVAGIIDGEGYLSMSCHKVANGKYYNIRPHLMIVNTSKAIIDFCHPIIGGFINQRKGRYTPTYLLGISGLRLDGVLEAVVPFLQAKKEIARKILEWIALRNRQHTYGRRGYTEEQIHLANEIRDLTVRKGHQHRRIDFSQVTFPPPTIVIKRPWRVGIKHLRSSDELKKVLEEGYINQKLSQNQLGLKLEKSKAAIQHWMRKFEIPVRDRKERIFLREQRRQLGGRI